LTRDGGLREPRTDVSRDPRRRDGLAIGALAAIGQSDDGHGIKAIGYSYRLRQEKSGATAAWTGKHRTRKCRSHKLASRCATALPDLIHLSPLTEEQGGAKTSFIEPKPLRAGAPTRSLMSSIFLFQSKEKLSKKKGWCARQGSNL